ncbi:MAG: hypothetical protein A2189_03515, partial [Paenibacillus sp. RIFOXYA1_FULL_44_5]
MKQIIVHGSTDLMKAAVLEDGKLVEYYVEHEEKKQLIGGIYKGRVTNVLPGMQAAFVDIGLSKNAFLYIDDILPAHLEKIPSDKPAITDLLRLGQEILVQISREPMGTKGARVTTHITLPGRWVVYLPEADYTAVSRKIQSSEERERLKEIGDQFRLLGEGVIFRTAAEQKMTDELVEDFVSLRKAWRKIADKTDLCAAPCEVYRDLDMLQRMIRDILTEEIDECIMDRPEHVRNAKKYLKPIAPGLAARIKLFEHAGAIFQYYAIDEQLAHVIR